MASQWEYGNKSPDEVRELLKRMLRLKDSAERIGSTAEAANFAAHIQRLLAAYKLSLSEIELEREEAANPYEKSPAYPSEWGARLKNYRVEWSEDLADIVARAHYCRLLIVEGTNVVIFLGRKTDVEVATYVFYRLARAASEICERDREAAKKRAQRLNLKWIGSAVFRESFYVGFSRAIYERYEEQKRKLQLEAGDCTALVRADKEVDKALDEASGGNMAGDFTEEQKLSLQVVVLGHIRGRGVNLEANALDSAGTVETRKLLTANDFKGD